jgi:hypothetical protein
MNTTLISPAEVLVDSSELTGRISTIIETARSRVKTVIDTEMVRAYWEIGREIVVDEQRGEKRAGYGEYVLRNLSRYLTATHGKGFDYSNLKNMRQFYLAYPIGDALRSQLSWTHYRLLMRHDDPQKRSFYEIECVNSNWSTRELERQMNRNVWRSPAMPKASRRLPVKGKSWRRHPTW